MNLFIGNAWGLGKHLKDKHLPTLETRATGANMSQIYKIFMRIEKIRKLDFFERNEKR